MKRLGVFSQMDDLHSLNGNISLEETLRIIDESIEGHQAPLLALKSRRNNLVPISRLPPETLCEIFSFAQLLCLDSTGPNHNPLAWINLTYVCRHWRNVALDSPRLWVYVPIGNLRWVQEMLRRSKESSLVVRSDSPYSDMKKSGLRLALKHIRRIRELSIRDISAKMWHALQTKTLQEPAPLLEHFCLEAGQNGSFFVTGEILYNANQLRHLELANCELYWNSYILRSLTHLRLHNVLGNSTLPGHHFVNILANMPELESLYLYDSLPIHDEGESSHPSEDIHFAHLRILQIHESGIPKLEVLFRCITFSPTTVVRVVCHDNDGDYDELNPNFSGIISGLARSYANANPDVVFQNLIVRRVNYLPYAWGVRLELFTEALEDFETIHGIRVNATPHLELVFHCPENSAAIARVLSDLLTSRIHLNDITQVFFAEKIPGLTFETIANTFGKLPRVHSVMAAKDAARSFLHAMNFGFHSSDAAGPSRNSVHPPSFPCLSLVYMYDMTFVDNHLLGRLNYSKVVSTQLLRHFLQQRNDLGAAIETLVLKACFGVFEEDIKLLEEVVVNVDWDAFEYIREDEEETREEENEQVEEDEDEYELSDSSTDAHSSP